MDARSSGPRLPLQARAAAAVAALYAFTALCLSGCIADGEKHAGVDEFPNSVYARVNGFLDEGKKSGEIGVPAVSDSLQAGAGFIVAAAKLAVAKIATGGFDAGPAVLKSAAGCTTGIATLTDSLAKLTPQQLYHKDSTQICQDGKTLHIKSVTVFTTGRVETAEITDADGDGILNPVAGGASKASLVLTALDKGVLDRTVLSIGPGPDNDFATEPDNLVYAASWSRTQGADTLASVAYVDADSDGVAVDNGKASVVDLDLFQKGPSPDHPGALWTRARLRMVVRYHVEAKEVRRARFEMEDQAHRVSKAEVLSRDGGSDFDMRDTVIAHFSTVGTAASDSLDTLDVRLTMKLGADFGSPADDSVYAIRAVATQKSGGERRAEFAFISSQPIPSGTAPKDGTVSMAIEYRDGTSLTLDGTLQAKALDVALVDREGRKAHVSWDAQGRGVLYERLP